MDERPYVRIACCSSRPDQNPLLRKPRDQGSLGVVAGCTICLEKQRASNYPKQSQTVEPRIEGSKTLGLSWEFKTAEILSNDRGSASSRIFRFIKLERCLKKFVTSTSLRIIWILILLRLSSTKLHSRSPFSTVNLFSTTNCEAERSIFAPRFSTVDGSMKPFPSHPQSTE